MNDNIEILRNRIANYWDTIIKVASSQNRDVAIISSIATKIARDEELIAKYQALVESIAASAGSGLDELGRDQSTVGVAAPRKQPTIKPTEVNLNGSTKYISDWNEVLVHVAEWLIAQGRSFTEQPNFLQRTEEGFSQSANPKKLSNGWYIEIGQSREALIKKSRTLLNDCGYENTKCQVRLRNGGRIEF